MEAADTVDAVEVVLITGAAWAAAGGGPGAGVAGGVAGTPSSACSAVLAGAAALLSAMMVTEKENESGQDFALFVKKTFLKNLSFSIVNFCADFVYLSQSISRTEFKGQKIYRSRTAFNGLCIVLSGPELSSRDKSFTGPELSSMDFLLFLTVPN